MITSKQYVRLLVSSWLILGNFVCLGAAFAATDLKWDLSYQSALREHPIGDNEFMNIWPRGFPKRLIHERLANYAGEVIEASLLIEGPDGHAGDPLATWFVKTKTTAQSCTLHQRIHEPCEQLDPARTEAFIREVMSFKPLRLTPSPERKIGEAAGKPILFNYSRFLSVYIGGRTLQRPIASIELGEPGLTAEEMKHPDAGRLSNAIARLMLTRETYQKRQAEIAQHQRATAFVEAVRTGDVDKMRSLVGQAGQVDDTYNGGTPAIAIAAGAGQKSSVDFLLQRGARIDAAESAALRAAVTARNVGMVEYLLSKGAKADPPEDSVNGYGKVFETPLGTAVRLNDKNMAQLLIGHGADVNAAQSRPPLVTASLAHNLPMMDLLIRAGANPNQRADNPGEGSTALVMLMAQSGHLDVWPKEDEKRQAILKEEATVEKVVRKLVAAGANVNDIDRVCDNAYDEAKTHHGEGMMRLLKQLGADPELGLRCRQRQ